MTRRYMKRNHGTEAPSNLLFFDCETYKPERKKEADTYGLKLRLWSAIALRLESGQVTRREVAAGKTPGEFWKFLYGRTAFKNPLWAFCHNAACDWSWLHLQDELRSRRLNTGPIERAVNPKTGKRPKPWVGKKVMEARPCFVIARHKGATVKLVDTGNYWTESVWQIGDKFGIPKLEFPGFDATDDVMRGYCLRDCEIIERAVCELIKWWVDEDCGTFQMTAPMLALANYFHTSELGHTIVTDLSDKEGEEHPANQLAREGYYGPRFEAFYKGTVPGPVYKVDVNSCYLAQMETQLFPRTRVGRLPEKSVACLERSLQAYGAVAQVRINARGNTYPKRHPETGIQLHCTGTFWTTLCGPELRRAVLAGDVEHVSDCNLYAMSPLFKGWAIEWHNRKMEARAVGDKAQEEFAKLIGTSLSGKWGQHGIGWKDVPGILERPECHLWITVDLDKNHVTYWRSVPGGVQRWETGSEPRHCAPIISAFISAYAREYMRSVFTELDSKTVYYIGSDALIVSEFGLHQLRQAGMIDPQTLGAFKVEGPYSSAEIVGTNLYRLGDKWVRSGIHGKPKPGIHYAECSERWEKMPAILARGMDGEVRFQQFPWAESEPNDKGCLGSDGWFVPIHLGPDTDFSDLGDISALADRRRTARPRIPSASV